MKRLISKKSLSYTSQCISGFQENKNSFYIPPVATGCKSSLNPKIVEFWPKFWKLIGRNFNIKTLIIRRNYMFAPFLLSHRTIRDAQSLSSSLYTHLCYSNKLRSVLFATSGCRLRDRSSLYRIYTSVNSTMRRTRVRHSSEELRIRVRMNTVLLEHVKYLNCIVFGWRKVNFSYCIMYH